MALAKRVILFLLLNFLVITMISLVLSIFNIRPFLSHYGLDLPSLMIFCAVWGMGGALISLALSRVMAKWAMGVKVIDPGTSDPELSHLLSTVHRLASDAGLPMPEVGVYQSNEVNAFATGPTQKRSLVAVSTGLIRRMKEEEVKAVLGHEITHIANGDMVTMTLLQGVVNAFVMFLARVLAYAASGLGRNRNSNSSVGSYGSYYLFVFLFQTIFMILGSLLIAAYSRWREFRADAGGARLAGKENMIEALQTLRVLSEIKDERMAQQPAFDAFKISPHKKRGFLSLFATHPPIEIRIERLRNL
jgi:heat shock protein HtpX